MTLKSAVSSAQLVFVFLLLLSLVQGQPQKATVHIRIVDSSGQDLGEPKVALFRSESNQQDFASRFRQGAATGLPFGVYKARVYTQGFWSSEREVRVFQSDTWVVLSLELGMGELEGGLLKFSLSGSIRNLPPIKEPVWLRLSGVYSAVVIDGKASATGDFSMSGIPQGLYVLIVTQDRKVLDVRTVQVPAAAPVDIKLAGGE
jgi:hypothetical protein